MTSALKLDPRISPQLGTLDDPWKKIKHSIYQVNLANHLPQDCRLRILDIGGGDGGDAIPLALQGHDVTLADESPMMIERAKEGARHRHISRNMTFHQVCLENLLHYYLPRSFDIILCHNVIQYLENMPKAMKTLSRLLGEGGMLSVISINRYKDDALSIQLRHSMAPAAEKRPDDKIYTPIFDPRVRRFPGNMVIDALQFADCDILGLYDVRCIVDYTDPTEIQFDPELSAKADRTTVADDRTPYYVKAHFFQIVAEKLR